MKKIKELKTKVQKIIQEEKETKEVKSIIDSILLDYKDSYTVYIRNMASAIENDSKRREDINHIMSYVTKDYREIEETMKTIQWAEEQYRKREIEDQIVPTIQGLAEEKENNYSKNVLYGLFFLDNNETVEEREKRQDDEIIERNVIGQQKNSKYINEIRNAIISEIKSSKSMVINKIKELNLNSEYSMTEKAKFENEIQMIIDKASVKLNEIEPILEGQDRKICSEIIEVWDQYCEENGIRNKTENIAQSQREQFKARLSENIKVDESKALEKIEQDNEKESYGKTLPGDLIL